MPEPKGIDVTIMGREFRVACRDDERDQLLSSVAYLDRKMREIRDHGRVIGVEKIAIMAALNITHELLTARRSGDFDMSEFRRRIEAMQETIDGVMVEQETLF